MSSSSKQKVAGPSPVGTDAAAASSPIDLRDPAPVLFYTGAGPIHGDAPARDLTGADLARLVRIAGLKASGGDPVKPATSAQLEELAAGLEASGAFSRELSPSSEGPEAPAEPAEEIV